MRKFLHGTGYLLILLLSVVAFGPALINTDEVRASLQDELSTALDRPVSIASIEIRLLPNPTVTLGKFSVPLGDTEQATFTFDKASAELELTELIQGRIAINHLAIHNTTVSAAMINAVKQLFPNTDNNPDSRALLPVTLKTVSLQEAYWQDTERKLGPFHIKAHWQDQLQPYLVEATDDANDLHLAIKPKDDGWHFGFTSPEGKFPWSIPVALDSFNLSGFYRNKTIRFELIQLSGMDSEVMGSGDLNWQSDWQLNLDAEQAELDLAALLKGLNKTPIPGIARGGCKINMQAATAHELVQHMSSECDMNYHHKGRTSPIQLTTKRIGADTTIEVFARDLVLPIGPPLALEAAQINGVLQQNTFNILEGNLQAYQGNASVTGTIDWSAQLAIRFASRTHDVQLEPLLATFDERKLTGGLTSQCKGELDGASLVDARDHLQLQCDFQIANGKVLNADLEQAARLIKDDSDDKPRQTTFDQLAGKLAVNNRQYSIDNLSITSAALAASGNLQISSDKQLQGKLSVGVNKTGNILTVPLVVSGTTQDPSFMPTKSSMTGAGAGTLLLGPGVGTAIGAKIGEAVGNLTNLFKRKQTVD